MTKDMNITPPDDQSVIQLRTSRARLISKLRALEWQFDRNPKMVTAVEATELREEISALEEEIAQASRVARGRKAIERANEQLG